MHAFISKLCLVQTYFGTRHDGVISTYAPFSRNCTIDSMVLKLPFCFHQKISSSGSITPFPFAQLGFVCLVGIMILHMSRTIRTVSCMTVSQEYISAENLLQTSYVILVSFHYKTFLFRKKAEYWFSTRNTICGLQANTALARSISSRMANVSKVLKILLLSYMSANFFYWKEDTTAFFSQLFHQNWGEFCKKLLVSVENDLKF